MLIAVTHVMLLIVCQAFSETKADQPAEGNELSFFQGRGNVNTPRNETHSSINSFVQCVGVVRGILFTVGVHLEPRVEVIGRCPLDTKPSLANSCSTDIYDFPPEAGSVGELQNLLISQLGSNRGSKLGVHLNLAIRKVSPVVDTCSGVVYANIYCAQCHNATINGRIKRLPKKLLCHQHDEITKWCFVKAQMPENVRHCDASAATPRFQFNWDNIFTLLEEEEENDADAGEFSPSKIFKVLQWICCIFSIFALIAAICVFASSARLRHPLPGKMMIALCCTLLGTEVAFILASGTMDFLKIHMRPMCITFAWLLHSLLLISFAWMAIFAVELFRTFGLTKMFRQCLMRIWCEKGSSNAKATSVMLRARRSGSSFTRRFKHQMMLACLIPLCFTIPALATNECAYRRLKPLHEVTKYTQSHISEETELGFTLYHLNPGFCPPHNSNYAWFSGQYAALLTWFLVPAGSIICFNFIALIIVCIQICQLKRETGLSPSSIGLRRNAHVGSSKSLLWVCTKLTIILGAGWFIQLITGLWPELDILRRVAGLVNSSQGGIVAISMLAGSKARRAIARQLSTRCCRGQGVSEYSSRSGQEMTTSIKSTSKIKDPFNSQISSRLQSSLS